MSGAASTASSSSSSTKSSMSSRLSTANSPSSYGQAKKETSSEPPEHLVYHNTFQTQNYHFIGGATNPYGLNGTATTSSGGSSSGYDTLSISTALGGPHLNDNSINNSSSSGSGASINQPQRFTSSSFMLQPSGDDNVYSDLGHEKLEILMNNAMVCFYRLFTLILEIQLILRFLLLKD